MHPCLRVANNDTDKKLFFDGVFDMGVIGVFLSLSLSCFHNCNLVLF